MTGPQPSAAGKSRPRTTAPTVAQATAPEAEAPERSRLTGASVLWTLTGLAFVLALAWAVRFLTDWVPEAAAATGWGDVAKSVEYPVYAIVLGFAANALVTATGLRSRLEPAFRTELFIKVGLVLLGASIDFAVIARAFGPSLAQACLLVTAVFLFTWWMAGLLGIDDRLRALLATSLAVCGVSAAVAAAGAVQAKKEQLAFTATLVVVFAVPSIFLLPWLAGLMGLSDAVTGAWIGGNIDTTAAVTAAGAVAGEEALQIASIVKVTQNALLGVVAVVLTLAFASRGTGRAHAPGDEDVPGTTETSGGTEESARPGEGSPVTGASAETRPSLRRRAAMVWERFPKFVLGFLAASAVATLLGQMLPPEALEPRLEAAKELQTWALTLAFVSIGLEFRVSAVREAGWRPVAVFGTATVFNLLVGLALASLLFAGVQV
ncbi:YeiH family protein [Brevibacterium salitolerans]|uniref:Sulfate exporter family transporter n=1 Tax=Brevibacterium salitolerans TaxID=1403566 RepID=A0ABN2WDG7_9MICO